MMDLKNRINKDIFRKLQRTPSKHLLVFTVLMIGLFLAGCRASQNPTPPSNGEPIVTNTPATATQEPTATETQVEVKATEEAPGEETIADEDIYAEVDPGNQAVTFWHTFTGDQEKTLLEIIATFNDSNSWGITVSAKYQGSGEDLGKKMLTFMNTEDRPSLVVADGSQAATYHLAEALTNLSPLVDHEIWGLEKGESDDFYPGLYEQGVFPAFGGIRLSYPLFGRMNVVYYNADWLAELGYSEYPDAPWAFTEAVCTAAGQPFSGSTAGGSWGIQFPVLPTSVADWVTAFGGKLFDSNSSQYNFERNTIAEAMNFLQGLSERGCWSPVSSPEEARVNFSRGVALMVIDSTDAIPDFRTEIQNEANFNWRIAPLPHTTGNPVGNVTGTSASIPETTPETQLAAWLFLRYFTSPEIQARWVQGSDSLPARESTTGYLADYFSSSPAYQMTLELLKLSTHEPAVPRYEAVQRLSQAALSDILAGAETSATLAQLNEAANQIQDEQMALIPESQDPWTDVDPSGQTITFWHPHTGARQLALNEIVNEFNAANKWGISVIPESQEGYGNIFMNLLPVLGTEEVPDLVTAYQEHAAAYQLADGLVDMTNLVESSVWGLSTQEKDDFYPGIYTQDIYSVFDDARLGFPIQRSIDVLYYNAEWLTELGFDGPPATLEEFKQMACASSTGFSKSTAESSLGYSFYIDSTRFSSWVFANGGELFDADTQQFSYNNSASIKVADTMVEMIESECAATSTERSEVQYAFGEGSLLFMIDSSFHIPSVEAIVDENAGFDWGVTELPSSGAKPMGHLFGASVSLTATTPEAQLAGWLFLKYFTTPEIQARWAQASYYLPVRISAAGLSDNDLVENPNNQAALEYLAHSRSEPPLPGYDFIRQEVELALVSILDGADPAATLDSLTATANQILTVHIER